MCQRALDCHVDIGGRNAIVWLALLGSWLYLPRQQRPQTPLGRCASMIYSPSCHWFRPGMSGTSLEHDGIFVRIVGKTYEREANQERRQDVNQWSCQWYSTTCRSKPDWLDASSLQRDVPPNTRGASSPTVSSSLKKRVILHTTGMLLPGYLAVILSFW